MAKHWSVTVDFSGSVTIPVEAQTAEEAEKIAEEKFRNEPYYWSRKGYVGDPSVWSDGTEEIEEEVEE